MVITKLLGAFILKNEKNLVSSLFYCRSVNKGDFCLRMLELFLGFSAFRTFHRTSKFERQKLINRILKEDYPSTGRRRMDRKDINIKTNST